MARGRARLMAAISPTDTTSSPEKVGRGPYKLGGCRLSEVWLGERLLASYTTNQAAAFLADTLNDAWLRGYAAAAEHAREVMNSVGGEIVREVVQPAAPGSDPASVAIQRYTLPGQGPELRLGPGGDFARDVYLDSGVSGESAGTKGGKSSETAEAVRTPRDPERGPIHRPGSSLDVID